jgi:putative endonuclease
MNPVGRDAEDRALTFLQERGLRLVERNWRCRGGELDLVMREGDVWVFVEVRHRSGLAFGGAAASISSAKQQRLRLAAELYLQQRGVSQAPARVDAVLSQGDGRLAWLKNILA